MPPNPNPELYPPYVGQTYVPVHTQDLQGVGSGYWIDEKKILNTVTTFNPDGTIASQVTTDSWPNGPDWTIEAKFHVNRGQFGTVYVQSKTPPYLYSNAGYPLAFSTRGAAEAALANMAGGGAQAGYKFWGRNPRFEIAQTIDSYKQNAEEFLEADLQIATGLTARGVANANSVFAYYAAKLVNQDSNNQFVLGLSAASGGGQNTTYLANSLSVSQLIDAADKSLTYSGSIPVVVPFESPLISDSHASAVEAKNAGEIRDQQIRQTISSAGGVYRGVAEATKFGYTFEGASIMMGAYGQAAAASQT
jgi:hypothetical protein